MAAVDVYTFPLRTDPARVELLQEILSPAERERFSRFRFSLHRRQAIICRGTLRETLSRYLDLDPAHICLAYNRHGKPYVAGSQIHFNVSHSSNWAMIAVSTDAETGIDIERIEQSIAQERTPERFFSPSEAARLRALPESQQTEAFFRCWTRKEAYIKARGLGMALPLDSFDVSFGPGEPAAFLSGVDGWSIQDLDAPPGYAAAVVAEGSELTVFRCSAAERPNFCRRKRAVLADL